MIVLTTATLHATRSLEVAQRASWAIMEKNARINVLITARVHATRTLEDAMHVAWAITGHHANLIVLTTARKDAMTVQAVLHVKQAFLVNTVPQPVQMVAKLKDASLMGSATNARRD